MSTADRQIATQLSGAVNTFSLNPEGVAEALTREHRTLQQSFTRVCVAWLKQLADSTSYDDRNYASVKLAQDLLNIEGVSEVLDRGLPMI